MAHARPRLSDQRRYRSIMSFPLDSHVHGACDATIGAELGNALHFQLSGSSLCGLDRWSSRPFALKVQI